MDGLAFLGWAYLVRTYFIVGMENRRYGVWTMEYGD